MAMVICWKISSVGLLFSPSKLNDSSEYTCFSCEFTIVSFTAWMLFLPSWIVKFLALYKSSPFRLWWPLLSKPTSLSLHLRAGFCVLSSVLFLVTRSQIPLDILFSLTIVDPFPAVVCESFNWWYKLATVSAAPSAARISRTLCVS